MYSTVDLMKYQVVLLDPNECSKIEYNRARIKARDSLKTLVDELLTHFVVTSTVGVFNTSRFDYLKARTLLNYRYAPSYTECILIMACITHYQQFPSYQDGLCEYVINSQTGIKIDNVCNWLCALRELGFLESITDGESFFYRTI